MYDNVRKCVVSTIKKMSERCPLQSAVARNAVIFNSEILLENTERNLQKKFKSLSQHLVSLRTVSSHEADKALIQHGNVKTDHWKAGVDLSKISHLNDLFQRIESCKVSQILLSHQNRCDTKPWRSRC